MAHGMEKQVGPLVFEDPSDLFFEWVRLGEDSMGLSDLFSFFI